MLYAVSCAGCDASGCERRQSKRPELWLCGEQVSALMQSVQDLQQRLTAAAAASSAEEEKHDGELEALNRIHASELDALNGASVAACICVRARV